ncbi:MAG: nicotinate-nucleotide--dimethylbenzimidazole phosphoribosyltransferase [Anaerolineales bacterium]|nr:nicotinate-nucleotide--dimethylbenzimidazole phosphoribosyltransferase [Anaerolineales bacterium]MCX7753670.1 nicotinate-nucleotide--dimethylbenzimidazole phosphoribosyltransferase [Anaerolineales bacterium]MDW8279141.1 nicotinate-nucleotide--dimethylbenzimidazole phosphoribosyltransferase [Anaerolineales bacterium]
MNLPFIPSLDVSSMQAARARQDTLTKPQGSLGRLEELSIQLAGIYAQPIPSIREKAVIVMAGDHGVVAEGVSAFPQEVTPQMVLNFLNGGAAINVLARCAGARVVIVDIGVAAELPEHPRLHRRKLAFGTGNIAQGPAMTRAQAEQAIQTGIEVVEAEIQRGLDAVATGEMGIGNTTPSAAIAAVLTGQPASQIAGRGTGLDDAGLERKIAVIERALSVNQPNPQDGLDVLSKVGGFEIGGLAGVMIGAASHRKAVLVDGFISTAAAMIAISLCPDVKPYLIAAHRSRENGHGLMLDWLGLKPLLDFDLRLGEGTGAALAFPILQAALAILREMATFGEAGVSEKAR